MAIIKKINKIILNDQHYGCAEALISKYGSTNKYIPIIFLPKHKDQVKLNGDPVYAGSHANSRRLIISPCHRCRLLSAPYLLWGVLYKGWGLGDLNLAAKRRGQTPIQPRFFRAAPTNNQQPQISEAEFPNGQLDVLPQEMLVEIFKYLTPEQQIELSAVSKGWRQILCSQILWSHNWTSLFSQTEYLKQKNIGNYRKRFFIIKNRLELMVDRVFKLLNTEFLEDEKYFDNREDILGNFETLIKDIKVNFCELIYQFLKQYPDVNRPYALGCTFLHIAVALGEFDAVRYLVTEQGADINATDCRGNKPLAIAIELCPDLTIRWSGKQNRIQDFNNFKKIIKFLIINGADIDNINILDGEEEFNTAVGNARLNKNEAIVEVIEVAISERNNLVVNLRNN